jgi:phage-related protein
MKKALTGTEKSKGAVEKVTDTIKGLGSAIGNIAGAIALAFSSNKFLAPIANFGKSIIAPILAFIPLVVGAIETLVLSVAVALGVSVGAAVAIIIAVIAAIIAIVAVVVIYWDQIMGAIKVAAQAASDFVVGVWQGAVGIVTAIWNTLYDVFAGPVKFILQFIDAVFTLIIAIIALTIQGIVLLFVALVKGIFDILSTVAGWINDNVVQPVVNFFVAMWNTIVQLAKAAWDFIFNNILRPVASWISVNVVTPVFNIFAGLWSASIGLVGGFWNGVMNILRPFASWIYGNVILPVLSFFNFLWDSIRNGLSNMLNGLASLFGNLGNIVKAPINSVIDKINETLRSLNKLKIPDWVPGIGGKQVNFPQIPRLARGGIVQSSTIANLGENGAEAIVPLENNLEWIDKLANKINSASGRNGGMPIQLTVQIGEDKVATKIIELINEKTQMSGRNSIFV